MPKLRTSSSSAFGTSALLDPKQLPRLRERFRLSSRHDEGAEVEDVDQAIGADALFFGAGACASNPFKKRLPV
jgi:hypothetical protein